MNCIEINLEQRSPEWFKYRNHKIGASDASSIMELNPWKSPIQLWEEKCDLKKIELNEAMIRGMDLEPVARDLFVKMTGISVKPVVLENSENDFMIASLDGISEDKKKIVEIKCGGNKLHEMARDGIIPDYYKCQMQHQMSVTGLEESFYFSFYENEGLVLSLKRDDDFIKEMIGKEKEFHRCVMDFEIPPSKYVQKGDFEWIMHTDKLKELKNKKKEIEKEEEEIRSRIISMCDENNCQGNGITVSKVIKKGSVDYEKIVTKFNVNVEEYRKIATTYWKIT